VVTASVGVAVCVPGDHDNEQMQQVVLAPPATA
jgi:hypothetical protein